ARRLARHRARLAGLACLLALVGLSGWLALRLARETEKARTHEAASYEKMVLAAAMKLLRGRTSLSPQGGPEGGVSSATLFPSQGLWGAASEGARRAVEEAVAELEQAAEALPDRFEARFHRARGLLLLARKAEALRELEAALRSSPGFVPARVLRAEVLGGILGGKGKRKGSREQGGPSAEEPASEPREPWARSWLEAHRAVRARRWREAAEAYGDLIALEARGGAEPYLGSSIETLLGRGAALLELKDLKGAQRDFLRAWTLGSGFLEPPLLLGKACYLGGERREAGHVFAELFEGAAARDEAALWIAEVYRSLGDLEKGLEWAGNISGDLVRERLEAACLESLGRLEEAVPAWRRVAQLAPGDAEATRELGGALLRQAWVRGDWGRLERGEIGPEEVREIIEASRRAVELAPGDPRAARLAGAISRAMESNRSVKDTETSVGTDSAGARERSTSMLRQEAQRTAVAGALALGLLGGLPGADAPRGKFTDCRNVGPRVNTGFIEYSAFISPDGLELYFITAGNVDPRRASSWRGDEDGWVAARATTNEDFGEAMNLQDFAGEGVVLNGPWADGATALSADGRELYYASDREGTWDIYVATRPEAGAFYETAIKLGPKVNTPDLNDNGAFVTADGLTLFFTRNLEQANGLPGVRDIWWVTRENAREVFGDEEGPDPVRLEDFDISYDEWRPRLSSDGLTLFFSDMIHHPVRPRGEGLADAWVATRPRADAPFGEPVNLNDLWPGSCVNTPFHDGLVALSADWPAAGSKIYFTSDRPGTGGPADIWEATWVPGPLPVSLQRG
ncbi:MAG: PD40 domain-containing protein, partial [Planctomycetes bacterium]|nr:PD40 domain-containing protein [Planctomycetota bacterium]